MCHNVKEGRIKSLLNRSKGENEEILFHHRFSTSTPDVRNACHPFSTKNFFENEYIGVHNGVINNTTKLKEDHEKLGINYVSTQPDGRFNDSEALIYDLARFVEGDVTEITARGTVAFIMIKRNSDGKPVHLLFGRNYGNPLKIKRTEHSLTLSSVGEGEDVEPNKLYCYNYDTKIISKRPMVIQSGYSYGSGYSKPATSTLGAWGYPKSSESTCTTGTDKKNFAGYKIPAFKQREGSYESVKNEILQECGGNYDDAAIKAIGEATEGADVVSKAYAIIEAIPDGDVDNYHSAIDSYFELEAYVKMLEHISSELEERSTENYRVSSRSSIDEDSDDLSTIFNQVNDALAKA